MDEDSATADAVDGTADDATSDPAADQTAPEPPTLLARARALWCQLVSGLG